MKKISKQGLVISQKIINLAKQLNQDNQAPQDALDQQQYPYVPPRIFPNDKIPTKVALYRKIKEYNAVDLNQNLYDIDWAEGSGQLCLSNYVFSNQSVIQYGCSQKNISMGKVKAKAYCFHTKRYQFFQIDAFDQQKQVFSGFFKIKNANDNNQLKIRGEKLSRAMICFNFQDPIYYINDIRQGIKRRKKVMDIIRYQFYVDNMDLQGAPTPSNRMLQKIKQFALATFTEDVSISLDGLIVVVNHYKRVMNQILFQHEIKIENLPIYIPTKYERKSPQYTHIRKKIKIKKADKILTLVPKSTKQRLQDIKFKSLFVNQNITHIILYLKQKLEVKPYTDLFLPIKQLIMESYLIEQERSFQYSYSAFNQYIIDPISSQIRRNLQQFPDGWFRMYQQNRSTYLDSKLHRMFIMINNVLRDWVVDQMAIGLNKYYQFLQSHSPEEVIINSVYSNMIRMKNRIIGQNGTGRMYMYVIIIEMIVQRGKLKLSHGFERIKYAFKKLIMRSLDIFSNVPSPEPIVLKQLFGGYKNQQGIKIQYLLNENPNTKFNKYPQVKQIYNKICEKIEKICQPINQYQNMINQTVQRLKLQKLIEDKNKKMSSLRQIIQNIKQLTQKELIVHREFVGSGSCIGFFFVNYQLAKLQILEYIQSEREYYKKQLISQNMRLNKVYNQNVIEIQKNLSKRPKNIKQLMQKQNLMKNLKEKLENQTYRQVNQIRQLCNQLGCRIQAQDLSRQIETNKIINSLYRSQSQVRKQFQTMRRQEILKIQNTKKDIEQSLRLLMITKEGMSVEKNVQHYRQYAAKVRYVLQNLNIFKAQAQQAGQKQLLLQIENTISDLILELNSFQKEFQPYQLLWISVQNWKNVHNIWMSEPIGSYQLKQPELLIKNLTTNLKKSSFILGNKYQEELQSIANKFRSEIEQFEPKLQLLRLLKKKGLTKKHLQQIGVDIHQNIESLTLSQALQLGLFELMDKLETVSNDAWNQFSLEQVLERLMKQISEMKFNVSSYKDKKRNDIFIIVNYKQLIERIDLVLSNIEAVQFNPMVKMFQIQIKLIYEKSRYISKSLSICEQFQKLLIELHPIFDSTDIVKQIPSQNKKFSKVLRIWLELLTYIKSILSVNDSCGSQNIYEKVKHILTAIEQVKKQLINFLEQKRKGFSRFYLLSNSEMFELFSATSDIQSVNSLIPKLFDSINYLKIDKQTEKIIGVGSENKCELQLVRPITYKGINIQNWLNSLQKQIRISINERIKQNIQSSDKDINWIKIIQDSKSIPQIVYLLYEIHSLIEIQSNLKDLTKFKERQQKILSNLIIRKKGEKMNKIDSKGDTILCSLIIMLTSKLQIADRLTKISMQSIDDFQWKKLIKCQFQVEPQTKKYGAFIETLNYKSQYGCQFLGNYSRLVITNLTQKMQVIYYLAQKYSLGTAAVGPAGTGKTQTTKDIAKIVGKACLIYNCSQNFHQSTFLRLIKGLAITGLWMCFDQFNRLNYKLLSIAAQQISYLLKFRSYGRRLELSFMGDTIWLDPQFQFCITYNPTYQGRQSLSKNLNELFRTVAVVTPDQLVICQALLFSYGYSRGEKLSKNIINIFKKCRDIWYKQQTYDFGLRALRSVISMSYNLSTKESEQNSIIQSLKYLNCPKMKKDDNQIFLKIISQQFMTAVLPIQNKGISSSGKLTVFSQILNIRDGILLCGDSLSGKQTVLDQFNKYHSSWEVSTIFHDVLTIDQLYGKLDPTTKLWKDGFFTSVVRNNINSGENRPNLLIVLNGSVYSQWIQNLNSFLDGTRKLSLASGQTLNIPKNLKLTVSCPDLQKASPATITRFGIINYEPLKQKQLIKRFPNFPEKLLDFYEELQEQVRNDYLTNINSRLVLNWALNSLPESHMIKYDDFIYSLAQIYEGLLNKAGKLKFEQISRKFLSLPYSPFQFMVKMNGEPSSTLVEFKKFQSYHESSEQFSDKKFTNFQEIFIPTLRSFKINNEMQRFILNVKSKKINKILILFGDHSIGKTKIGLNSLSSLAKEKNSIVPVFLTRKTSCKSCYEQIFPNLTRKNVTKLGADPGCTVNIWIEDVNMPTPNQYEIIQTAELLRLICCKNEWYNYHSLTKQSLEDIIIMADAKIIDYSYKNPLNLNSRLHRHIQPLFCNETTKDQLNSIFKQLIERCLANNSDNLMAHNLFTAQFIEKVVKISEKIIDFYWWFKQQECFSKNIISFSLNDLYRSIKGLILWKLPQNIELIAEIVQFQISRNLISKLSSKALKNEISEQLLSQFSKSKQKNYQQGPKFPLFHNLENNLILMNKCQKISNIIQFTNKFQCICDQYKTISHSNENIIVFPDMIEHLLKVYRTLSLDYSHVGVVGMAKCGKNTIVKLASYLISSECYTVKEANQSLQKDWQQTIKYATKCCFKNKIPSILLIKNKFLANHWCVEDLNKLINTMYLPHIYSEPDTDELLYMMQSELIRRNLPINKQTMWKQFLHYLKEKFHIVLFMNPSFKTFKSLLVQYPSLVKIFTFFYLDKWPTQALYLIAKLQMPDFGHSLSILPQIHEYCQKICQNSKQSLLDSIWEGMYFNFIEFFIKMYYKNQSQLEARKHQFQQSQKVIQQTQDQLQKTKNKIKKLQPTIIMIQNQTAKTVKNLQIQRKNAEQTHITLSIKNQQLQKIIKESKILKEQLQHKVHIVDLQIAKAWENVSLIKPNHIAEIKALSNPSEFIKTVLSALVILTYDGVLAKQMKDVNGHITVEQSYFETAKKFVLSKQSKSICKMLIQFKRESVSKEMFHILQQKCLSYKRWSDKQAKTANKAIYYFFLWVEAVANQYRIFVQTQPLRDQLQKISNILSQKQIEVATIRKQFEYYQEKINEYEAHHKTKKQALQEYRIQIRKFERMLTRGQQLITEISGEKVKWVNYIHEIDQKIKHNFGDSIVMAATLVYISPHVYEIRKKIKQHISKQCIKKNIPCGVTGNKNCEIPWYITREQEQIFQTLQIHQNQFLVDNVKIAENSNQVILMLDPEEQGIKLMKMLNWQYFQSPIDKISEYSPNLVRSIESAILYGRIVFIEVDASMYNNSLSFVINPTISTVSEKKQIKSGDKTIPIHQNYRLYLYTNVYSAGTRGNRKYSMELLTNIQIINFKMTSEQLEERILQIIINTQLPHIKAQIQEIYRTNIKDTITLNGIQEKLLLMFSSQLSSEEILENDQIINTVVHSNRLYKQISQRIQQSQAQSVQIQQQKKPYYKKAQETCQMYENIQRLKLVKSLYSYSYNWFLDLFKNNVHNFSETLYLQISKGLKIDEKIVVAILIAQILHPNLPWKCLFNVEQSRIIKTIYTTHEEQNENQEQTQKSEMRKSQIRLYQQVRQKLLILNRQLPISESSWNSIILRIDQVKRFIPTLQSNFSEQPQIFIDLVIFGQDRIFQAIPDEYSHLDFFYKILLVSCFRPECVIGLLKQWIRLNMGSTYIETMISVGNLIKNTMPYRPIIAIMDDISIEGLQKIRQIHKQSRTKQEVSAPHINYHFTSLSESTQFDATVKSSITQDAWLIVESVNSIEVLTFIKQYFEELTILPQKQFRLWIIMAAQDENSLKSDERFSQFCDKIRIKIVRDLFKDISSSFFKYQDSLHEQKDFFQKSKKKMLISQLCILHHILTEFSDRYTYLSGIHKANRGKQQNSTSILTLTQWDLKLLIEQICHYKIQQFSKVILHQELINKLTYGSQVSTFYLNNLIHINSGIIINSIITERGQLWQSLWCEEKFPKDHDEYEHQAKNIILNKRYMQRFGLDNKLIYKIKINQYEVICKFYQKTVFHTGRGVSHLILDKLQNLLSQIKSLKEDGTYTNIVEQLSKFKSQIKQTLMQRFHNTFHFCRIQLGEFQNLIQMVVKDINSCMLALRQQRQIQKDSELEHFLLRIYMNIAPWSESHRPVTLTDFCKNLQKRLKMLNLFLSAVCNFNNVVNCPMIENFKLYLQALFEIWGLQKDLQKYKFVYIGLQNFKQSIIKKQLDSMGFQLPDLDQYPEQKIHTDYGDQMQLNTRYKKEALGKLWEIKSDRAKQRGIVGYALLQDLLILNSEVQIEKNHLSLKVDILQEQQASSSVNFLIKSVVNFAANIKNISQLGKSIHNGQNSNAQILSQQKSRGILLIVQTEDEIKTRKTRRKDKVLERFEDEKHHIAQIPCYEYSLIDITQQNEPVAIFYSLVLGKEEEKIEAQIARKNIHFSLRP